MGVRGRLIGRGMVGGRGGLGKRSWLGGKNWLSSMSGLNDRDRLSSRVGLGCRGRLVSIDFLGFMSLSAATTSSKEGNVSRSAQGGSVGSSSSTEWSERLLAVRRLSKCSVHLARIPCLSLIRDSPSDKRTGTTYLFLGP